MADDTPSDSQPTYPLVEVKNRSEVSQNGVTWKFDHPVKSGQFVNGDWWVVGPVTVVSVSPMPAPGPLDGEVTFRAAVKDLVKDIKGPMNFILGFVPPQLITNENDNRMRNGSMVITKFGPHQGYDSRSTTYDPSASIVYPYKLDANRTLISTISEANPVPDSFCHPINWSGEKKQRTLLKTAVVLTCLASEPPPDAFRPAYAGTDKKIYRAGDLKWDLLLNLKLDNMDDYFQKPWFGAGEVATWQDFEGYFQPVFLYDFGGIDFNQVDSYLEPAQNQSMAETACFGREDSRLVSIASLMVHLDVPKEKKRKLVDGLVQRGIDLSGAIKAGNEADPDRCDWLQSGLKWPIFFSSLMLDKPELRQFANPIPFHEDITTYYGTGWFGQTALWRIVWHDHLIDSDEERSPEQRIGNDGISENYRSYGSSGKAYLGTALSIRLMKAIKIWGHDAFLDYCDRWIDDDPRYKEARGLNLQPDWETNTWDPFVTAMWKAYRKTAPEQEMSGQNFKSSWERKPDGTWHISWAPNPKPDPAAVAAHVEEIHKAFPDKYPPPDVLAKLFQPEEDAASPKVRDECVARTQVREAEAKANPVPANTVVVVAAPDFSAEGGGNVKLANNKIGAVGGNIVYGWDNLGHWVEWNVDVPAEGYYDLTVCYCSPLDRIDREITINGEVQEPYAPMSFPTTHGWSSDVDNWSLFTAQNPVDHQPLLLKLKQGKNAIRLTNINSRGLNVNYVAVTSPDVQVTRELLAKALPPKSAAPPQK
jgi:hypothetical protein